MSRLHIVATCARGLEEVLAAEIRELGREPEAVGAGGVSIVGSWVDVWRLNWRLRSANRILVELGTWPAPDRPALHAGALALVQRLAARRDELGDLLTPERTFAIQATSLASRLADTRLVALVAKDGIVDAQRELYGRRSDVDRERPDLPLRVRLHRDQATLLLDTSGDPLDRRGYRALTSEAAAREQLVAAAILASGWDGRGPVVDPMCGSGTFLAEAAAIALGRSPQRLRGRFGFERLPGFDPRRFESVQREEIPAPGRSVRLFGVDHDPRAIEAARESLTRAGFADRAALSVGDAFDVEPPAGPAGLVCMNPPWGNRLEGSDELWARIGDLLKQRFAGWTAVLLAGDERKGAALGLRPRRRIPVKAGAAELRILVLDLYA